MLALAVLAIAVLARPAVADGYTYSTIIVPGSISGFDMTPFPTQVTEATGINSSGTVAGIFDSYPFGAFVGYTDQAGSFSVVPMTPGSNGSTSTGINDLGVIVGSSITYSSRGTSTYGFTYAGGAFTTISVPNAVKIDFNSGTFPTAIDNAGAVAGYYTANAMFSPYPTQITTDAGFIYAGGNYTIFTVPGASNTFVYGINNSGAVSGYYTDVSGVTHGFLDQGGVITTIDVPGATNTYVTGLNDEGQLVGYYAATNTTLFQAFLDNNGVFTTLSGPPRTDTLSQSGGFEPFDINDAGVIVGQADSGSVEVGVIATPIIGGTSVPEPASLLLLTPAALLGTYLARKRA